MTRTKSPADIAAGHFWHCVDKELARLTGSPAGPDAIFACALHTLVTAGEASGLQHSTVMDGVIGSLVVEAYDNGVSVDELVMIVATRIRIAYANNAADEIGDVAGTA